MKITTKLSQNVKQGRSLYFLKSQLSDWSKSFSMSKPTNQIMQSEFELRRKFIILDPGQTLKKN